MADRLVLTKTDLAQSEALERLRHRLKRLSPSAALFEATLEVGPGPDLLFDSQQFNCSGKIADVQHWLDGEGSTQVAHGQAHDANRHDDRISTFCLTAAAPLDWTRFTEWLALLLANRGEQVLRVKGVLNVAGRSKPVVIHGVQHVFYPPGELDRWPDGDQQSRIVFITRDLPGDALERAFQSVAVEAVPGRSIRGGTKASAGIGQA
jgi:G3E family GTPase